MKRFAVLFLIVAAVAGMVALSVYPGRLSLWGWVWSSNVLRPLPWSYSGWSFGALAES